MTNVFHLCLVLILTAFDPCLSAKGEPFKKWIGKDAWEWATSCQKGGGHCVVNLQCCSKICNSHYLCQPDLDKNHTMNPQPRCVQDKAQCKESRDCCSKYCNTNFQCQTLPTAVTYPPVYPSNPVSQPLPAFSPTPSYPRTTIFPPLPVTTLSRTPYTQGKCIQDSNQCKASWECCSAYCNTNFQCQTISTFPSDYPTNPVSRPPPIFPYSSVYPSTTEFPPVPVIPTSGNPDFQGNCLPDFKRCIVDTSCCSGRCDTKYDAQFYIVGNCYPKNL